MSLYIYHHSLHILYIIPFDLKFKCLSFVVPFEERVLIALQMSVSWQNGFQSIAEESIHLGTLYFLYRLGMLNRGLILILGQRSSSPAYTMKVGFDW